MVAHLQPVTDLKVVFLLRKETSIALSDLRNSDLALLVKKMLFMWIRSSLTPLSPQKVPLLASLTVNPTSAGHSFPVTQVQCNISQSVTWEILSGSWSI
jgi:hypothetical protein